MPQYDQRQNQHSITVYNKLSDQKCALGAFNNYVDRILPYFDPPPLRGQFLYPKCGQKQTFFDPLPP